MTFLTAAINLLTIFWINRLVVQFIKEKYVDQCLQKFKMMPSSVLLCPRPGFTQFTVRNQTLITFKKLQSEDFDLHFSYQTRW